MNKLLVFLFLLATACGGTIHAADAPTLQPTETAIALTTPTPLPAGAALEIPAFDDINLHKQAMKSGFEGDIESLQNPNRYAINAQLSFEFDAIIRGAERVLFVNRTNEPIREIVFRLYANTPALGGRMTVTNVTANGNPVEPSFGELSSVMGVPLQTPLQPGDSVELTMQFQLIMAKGLNTSYGRFGYVSNIVSATAWYPTLSVYEPGKGWWTSLPSPQGDPAYTEIGLYDVRLTVPADVTVAMSGSIIETKENADRTVTHRDITGPMRDHAFGASTRYRITPITVDGTTLNLVHYKDPMNPSVDGTEYVKGYAETSVKAFNATFGEYPYREMDILQNPTPSGVEFPGLIQIAEKAWVKGNDFLEIVIAHEIGHQWFYGIVGNNQVEHPWVDESLTSYTEFVYMRAAYPEAESKKAIEYIASYQRAYNTYKGAGNSDLPLNLPVRRYGGFSYGMIVYRKGPLFYVELERLLGRETVYKAINEYYHREKYGIATSADVKQAFEDVSGQDLTEVFKKWVGGL